MENKEQCYYVTVRKSADFIYEVFAYSFEEALSTWSEYGEEIDVDPFDSVVIGAVIRERS